MGLKKIKFRVSCLCSMHGEKQRQTDALRIFIFRNRFAVWLAVKLRLKEENIIIVDL